MKLQAAVFALLSFSMLAAAGQEAAAAEPAARLRVVPLGVVPELVPELQDGVMGFAKEPEGVRPPRETQVWIGKKAVGFIPVSLNNPSEIAVKGGEAVELRIPEGAGNPEAPVWKPYLEIPAIAPGKDQSVFLTKANPKATWLTAPKQWTFDDSPQAFPGGSIRLLNLSSSTALFIVGEEKFQLPTGKQGIVRPPAKVVSLRAAVQKDGKIHQTLSTARKVEAGERLVFATIDWDSLMKNSPPKAASSMLVYLPLSGAPVTD